MSRSVRVAFLAVAALAAVAAAGLTPRAYATVIHALQHSADVASILSKTSILRAGLAALALGAAVAALVPRRLLSDRSVWRTLTGCLVLAGTPGLAGVVRMAWLADRVVVEPDASEYVAVAHSLATSGELGFEVNGRRLPSAYPPGCSALYAPVVGALGPRGAGFAAYLFGLAAVGLTALAAARSQALLAPAAGIESSRGRPWWTTPLIAAIFFLASPGALKFSAQPMSEAPTLMLVAAACCLAFGGRATSVAAAALGLISGVAVAVRFTNAVVLLPIVLHFLSKPAPRAGRLLPMLAGAAVPLVFLGLYAEASFGSFLATGYEFWAPAGSSTSGVPFGPRYLFGPPVDGETGLPNLLAYALAPAGVALNPFGGVWLLPTAVAAGIGAWRARPMRGIRLACAASALLTTTFFACYGFQDSRYLLPLLPVTAVALAPSIADAIRLADAAGRRLLLGLLFSGMCFAAGIANGYAGWLATLPSKGELGADIAASTEPDAAIVLPLDAATFATYVPAGGRLYVPLSTAVAQAAVLERMGVTVAADRDPQGLLRLAKERPVYLDGRFSGRHPAPFALMRGALPWRPVDGASALLRLEP